MMAHRSAERQFWRRVKGTGRPSHEPLSRASSRAAEVFAADTSRIATAISYYGDYADEIDAEIADADEASARAEMAWRVQQQLIA